MNPNRTTAPASSRITKPGPLFPECKHVEAFGDDGDYAEESDDEGESYVTLDLSRVDQTLIPNSSTYRLIGLDTATPYLQLSGTIMRGHSQTLLGTEMLFKEVEGASTFVHGSSVDDSRSYGPVQLQALVTRRIAFRELDIKPKAQSQSQIQPQHLPGPSDAGLSGLPAAYAFAPSSSSDADPSGSTLTSLPPDTGISDIGEGKPKAKAKTSLTTASSAHDIAHNLLYPQGVDHGRVRDQEGGQSQEVEGQGENAMSMFGEAFDPSSATGGTWNDMPGPVPSTSASTDANAEAGPSQNTQSETDPMPWLDPSLLESFLRGNMGMDIDA